MPSWETLYRNAYERGVVRIQSLKGVACAFHSVLDGLIRLTPDWLHSLLNANPSLKQAALKGCGGDIPLEIMSPKDFIQGLFSSLAKGAALQRMIRSEATYRWALETFGPGQLRLGGTSGNMARSLSPLGIPVTVYANPLTRELAELFGDDESLSVIVKENEEFVLRRPKQAARESGVFAIHWIMEYSADFSMELDGVIIRPGRANRYIPSWNPRNNQFRMSEEFAEGFLSLIDSYSHLLFSGFHILSEQYPDGSTCADVVRPLGDYLLQVRKKASRLRIHLEFASIASPKVRGAVLEHIVPNVHSLGCNETELPLLIDSLGGAPLAEKLRVQPSAMDFCWALALVLRETGLERIHFHNLGYYLCMEKSPWTSASSSRDALLLSAIMAAARAKNGLFSRLGDIEAGLSESIGKAGLEQLQLLAERWEQPSIREEGLGTCEGFVLSAIPAKVVKNPLFTVGLGDTISAGAFLTA
ncbi:MAG: ADP-dependent glucokinase/phosphofructokinase [Candidatus Omnitrophota bacterium]